MKVLKLSLKILAGMITLLLILAVIGYVALTRWVNPNDYKPQIIAMVHQETGRDLTLTGKLSWELFPNIGIHIGEASLSNPAGFSQETFAQIDSASLLVSWNQLLHGKVQISTLILNGLQLYLVSDGDKNNWTFPVTASSSSETASNEALSFMLQDLSLNSGTITYDNLQSKTHFAVNNLNVDIPDFSLIAPMSIKANGNFANDNLNSAFKLNTSFSYDLPHNILTLNNIALNSNSNYTNNNDQTYQINLKALGNVVADLNKQKVTVSNVQFTLNQMMNGTLNLTLNNFTRLGYTGNINIPAFSLGDFLNTFGQTLPNIPNKDQFSNTRLQTNFIGNTQRIALREMDLGIGNTDITGNLNFASFSPFDVREDLHINQVDLADFTDLNGARLPMQTITLQGDMSVDGFDSSDMPNTLNASQKIAIQSIVLKGFDLNALIKDIDVMVNNILNVKKVSDAYQSIQNQMTELADAQKVGVNASNGKQTDFGSLTGYVVIQNGVLTTPNLLLSGPLVKVSGQGKVNLNQKSMDYTLTAQVLASGRNIVKNLTIPYTLSGPFSNLQQGVDWVSVQTQVVAFIMGQLGRTVTSTVTTVISAPIEAVGGVAKGVAGALSHIFGGGAASAS